MQALSRGSGELSAPGQGNTGIFGGIHWHESLRRLAGMHGGALVKRGILGGLMPTAPQW